MTNYRLIRSRRRTVAMEVTRTGEVIVRAPMRMPVRDIERFVAGHEVWLARARSRVENRKTARALDAADDRTVKALRAAAKEYLPDRVAHYARVMGLSPASVKVTSAKTRFGSCRTGGHICFSYRLMAYPPEAIDYVVVHELAHMVEANHSPAFYRVVAGILPDYRARAALLKQ